MTKKIARILVPTDFSRGSDQALMYAGMLRRLTGAQLFVLHVVQDPTLTGIWPDIYIAELPDIRKGMVEFAHQSLTAQLRRLRLRDVTADIAIGPAAQVIEAMAWRRRCDLIVMGTHGRTGVSHALLGSVAERVLRSAPCPVLTVRQSRPVSRRRAPARRAA